MKIATYSNYKGVVLSLATNILLVYLLYTICKLVFVISNIALFPHLTFSHTLYLLVVSLKFDTIAILYTNSLFIFLTLFPFHYKESKVYAKALKILFVVVNSLAVIAQLSDVAYFPYTMKRTTFSVFKQFAGEDNIHKVVLSELLNSWYLFVIGIILIYALWKVYKQPKISEKRENLVFYYISRTITLLIISAVSIVLIRGGAKRDTRPITLSTANEYVNKPSETAIVLNTPFTILRTISRKPYAIPSYFSDKEELEKTYTPIHTPEEVIAQFKNKNVVLIILESFGKEYWGFYNENIKYKGEDYRGYTPFLDSLATESLTFKYSYANGFASIDGMPSNISSIPMLVEHFFKTSASLSEFSSVAQCLSRDCGYYTAFFHGAQKHSMGFKAFSRAAGFEDYFSREDYDNDSDFDGNWGIWDEKFLQYFSNKMSTFREPFFSGIFTLSSHHPFSIPKEYKDKFKGGIAPIHNTVSYADYAMRKFFDSAKQQPWYENTLFVITADHTNAAYLDEYKTELNRFAVPVIFYTPDGSISKDYNTDIVASQIDIMPSILGYLGYDKPYFAFGQDIFSKKPEDTFAFNYYNGVFQLIKGQYLLQFSNDQVRAIYKYKTDTFLRENLIGKVPEQAELEKLMKAIIQQYMYRLESNKLIIEAKQ